ncbi:uncharacterized protein LOC124160397 [Ischnura elegans]|uniref:uncharacterized protein LOC124160397 n=1 Tax=Ischnura elegans TaxID=197161 RepID=UPI001ED89D8A|nr:uncharacterized protein LOC124160397 [Ischnura elegans]
MDLPCLERLVGEELGRCRMMEHPRTSKRFKKLDEDLGGLLITAVENNAIDSVDRLLRCGADVNASRFVKGKRLRAIDISFSRKYRLIAKLLLERDTMMPDIGRWELEDFLLSMAEEFGSIEELFKKRDDFHEKVKKGDLAGMTDALSGKDFPSGHRYWIDRNGNSALYVALCEGKNEVFALLKSRNFDSLNSEKRKAEIILKGRRRDLDSVLGKQFEALKSRHLLQMESITLTRKGEEDREMSISPQAFYEAAHEVPEARLLMQCLQYDPDLEVIFDLDREDITCLCSRSTAGVPGMFDQDLNRIYVSGMLDTWSDTVSNLVHEMAHAALLVFFKNGGLPYREGDEDKKLQYNQISSAILRKENIEQCNEIIRRIEGYPEEHHPYELIVRIPEIITKLRIEGKFAENGEPWRSKNEKALFHFYRECVEKAITSWIKTKPSENQFSSLSSPPREVIEINNLTMPEPEYNKHNGIRYLQESNLAFAVSHLQASVKNLVVMDWEKMLEVRRTLEINVKRGYIESLAVVLDDGTAASLCTNSRKCGEDCPAFHFSQIKDYVILIVPKSFSAIKGNKDIEYKREHLSGGKNECILEGKVISQGRDVTFKEMIGFVEDGVEVESTLNSNTDSGVFTWIMEGNMITCGSELKPFREMRTDDFCGHHPEILGECKMVM